MLKSNKWEDRVNAAQAFYKELAIKDHSTELYALLSQTAAGGFNLDNIIYNLFIGAVYCVPVIGNFAAMAMSTVWSIMTEVSKKESNTSELVVAFKKQIQSMVDSTITTYDTEALIAIYKTCSTQIVKYSTDLRNLKADHTNTKLRTEVRETVKLALNDLQQGLDLASKSSFAVSELYMYAMMANTRLLLLRDLCANGKKWDIAGKTIKTSYKTELKKCIKDYGEWCATTYTTGYNKIKTDNTDDVNCFNKLQRYRTFMITQIFDMASMWPFLDVFQFPKGIVKLDRSRMLLSDTVGCPVNLMVATDNKGYYSDTCTSLESKLAIGKFYLWRGEHEYLYVSKDENDFRFVTLCNTFIDRFTDKSRRDVAVSGPTAVKDEVHVGSSASADETITIVYDIIPRAFKLSVAGDIACTSYDAKTYVTKYQAEESWHQRQAQYTFPNIVTDKKYFNPDDSSVHGGRDGDIAYLKTLTYGACSSTSFTQSAHVIQAVWSWGTNYDPNVRKAGTVDSAFVVFQPVELVSTNYISQKAPGHVFDPIKYVQMEGTTSMVQEHFGPGGAAMLFSDSNSAARFRLTPAGWAEGKTIKYALQLLIECAGPVTLFFESTAKVGVTKTIPLAAATDGVKLVGKQICTFKMTTGTAVDIHIGSKGPTPVYIRSIIVNKALVTAA
ncbi:hypothetical protein SAMD00019534_112330 [Acytostelium subglobosum LB1]|uniref:hypothetical protein n=1 Tax=Acytostelium subglobosum LB1 TaxID=1410327 RepID=UPI000644C556|nr:hypothetical protein SAMD00019534_112330 [Acytostelium subglobosum LB1]GAM28057.1 hypothetical protein SAMD00019534_112330 [Acytostelium subglobosum LB1]|eukprot:XP_012749016.1 hypothetical protein SAMD00019534_112330 [Acytostelium subglobosum LB1]